MWGVPRHAWLSCTMSQQQVGEEGNIRTPHIHWVWEMSPYISQVLRDQVTISLNFPASAMDYAACPCIFQGFLGQCQCHFASQTLLCFPALSGLQSQNGVQQGQESEAKEPETLITKLGISGNPTNIGNFGQTSAFEGSFSPKMPIKVGRWLWKFFEMPCLAVYTVYSITLPKLTSQVAVRSYMYIESERKKEQMFLIWSGKEYNQLQGTHEANGGGH